MVASKATKRLEVISVFESNSLLTKKETNHKNLVNKCIVIMAGFMEDLSLKTRVSATVCQKLYYRGRLHCLGTDELVYLGFFLAHLSQRLK